jgi:hypothetical protein
MEKIILILLLILFLQWSTKNFEEMQFELI